MFALGITTRPRLGDLSKQLVLLLNVWLAAGRQWNSGVF